MPLGDARHAAQTRQGAGADHRRVEHAYYIDFRNERGKYVEKALWKAANWEFAGKCYAAAVK